MGKKIIHLISSKPYRLKIGRKALSQCSIVACLDATPTVRPEIFSMIDEANYQRFGTSVFKTVTCKKCINLTMKGTIHGRPPHQAVCAL